MKRKWRVTGIFIIVWSILFLITTTNVYAKSTQSKVKSSAKVAHVSYRIKAKNNYDVYAYPRELKAKSKRLHAKTASKNTTFFADKKIITTKKHTYFRLVKGNGQVYGYIDARGIAKYATTYRSKNLPKKLYHFSNDTKDVWNYPAGTAYKAKVVYRSKKYWTTSFYVTKETTRKSDNTKYYYLKQTNGKNFGWIYYKAMKVGKYQAPAKPAAPPVSPALQPQIFAQDLSVPIGGSWRAEGKAFSPYDGIAALLSEKGNFHTQVEPEKATILSNNVNLSKVGSYVITYQYKTKYGTATARSNIHVISGSDTQALEQFKSSYITPLENNENNPFPHKAATNMDELLKPTYQYNNQFPTSATKLQTYKNLENKPTGQTYASTLILPTSLKDNLTLYNPQSIVKEGKYMYVIYDEDTYYGRLVRYDLSFPLKNIGDYRLLSKKASLTDPYLIRLRDSIKISPKFPTGHGQTLSESGGTLYMLSDTTTSTGAQYNTVIQKLDKNTLLPVREWSFKLSNRFSTSTSYYYVNNFTWAGNNEFYFALKRKARSDARFTGYQFYRGTITGNSVKVNLIKQNLTQYIGYYMQNISYNPLNDRLYIVSDSIYASFPREKLKEGTLEGKDIVYTRLLKDLGANVIETQDITFEGTNAYILNVRYPEILQANNITD